MRRRENSECGNCEESNFSGFAGEIRIIERKIPSKVELFLAVNSSKSF
jgi:hypothetical protein